MAETSTRKRVVLVDDEPDIVWSLVGRLSRELPDVDVEGLTEPEAALRLFETSPIDLLVTDIRMPRMSGMELLLRARQLVPALPFVVMTAYPTEKGRAEAERYGAVTYIEKPFEVATLVAVITRLLEQQRGTGFSGAVRLETLPDLVQLFMLSNSSGALRIRHGQRAGAIWFDRGAVIHSECGERSGAESFFEILTWRGGEFSMERSAVPPMLTIFEHPTALMVEAYRRLDESHVAHGEHASDDSAAPPVEDAVHPDGFDAGAVESELEHELDVAASGASDGSPAAPNRPEQTPAKDPPMANNIQSALESLRTLDGYYGSALVDSESGLTLGIDGGGPLNLEIASAGNTEVVRAQRKTIASLSMHDEIEDILITLGKQYHIIRPLKKRLGVFFYVAFDRVRANLALARLLIADTEKKLDL
jgi:DNA-binding response OmpR family regulator